LLGDLDAARNWGYAADYMEAMCMMLVAETPRDDTRAPEPIVRVGNAKKAHAEPGWAPRARFAELVRMLVDAGCASLAEQHQP
jgi:GDP-D-mannose dehydratase